MRPVGKYIIIEVDKKTTKTTKKGLILDERNREDVRYSKAKVLSVGDDVSIINKENVIYYDKHAGFDLEIEDVFYKVIKEHDIVVIL
tara:strand:+ start:1793 stop:2053 length:261 start_codon:yes stop_codon:yes gene_type:complete